MDLQGDVGAEAGADLRLQSRFSNGEPTRDATVRLLPPDGGEPLEVGRTDASGSLSFSLPSDLDGSWEIQVDGGPGHRDYLEMPVEGRQPQLDRLVEKPATLRLPHLAGGGAVLALVGLLGGGLVRLRRP
jgi:nickel transport protein